MNRRQHPRLPRLGRRHTDRRQPMVEYRRVLLIGTNKAWRVLIAYVFEDAGYVVYEAASAPRTRWRSQGGGSPTWY